MKYKIGLDVGSTTAKMVVTDEQGHVMWQRYERHQAQVKPLLHRYLTEVSDVVGDAEVTMGVTGSVGMQTAELLNVEFVQEVVAASVYARCLHPEVNALIDIGGEDSKVVLLADGQADLRMNGNCAGGTGAFIDQMAALLGLTHDQMNKLALQSTEQYTIAARCGVFAKTDVQNLVSRGVPIEDICASIFHSIAVQTVTTLAHGQKIEAPVLLCGGPLAFLEALRRAFEEYMELKGTDFVVSSESNLIPAVGTALQCGRESVRVSELLRRLDEGEALEVRESMPPLFESERSYDEWRAEKERSAIGEGSEGERRGFGPGTLRKGAEKVVIGIDSGSTTTKIIAARRDGSIVFSYYVPSLGRPVRAVAEGLKELKAEAERRGCELEVVGSCATGYGEELIKAAFDLDWGIVETMAHYEAARRLMPDVSFILDIGGQDMKAIFVEDGVVSRMELNEACSSGCGTFLQTFAESLERSIGDFAREACMAQHPCDLGSRCTVFMNSRVKQALREGAEVGDIAAGLSYSVISNCLYKVLKLSDVRALGNRIVVQGGTMRNDAVVRALELLTGQTVARSEQPEMMGAYGCALHAAALVEKAEEEDGAATVRQRSIDELLSGYGALLSSEGSLGERLHCRGCENQCAVTRYRFGGGKNYVSGNKCERVFSNNGVAGVRGGNIYPEKYRIVFDRESMKGGRRIGVPRMLNMYENFPFWHRLLSECGMEAVLSSDSSMHRYERALPTVMSDNVCFPAKLAHSHVAELCEAGVERILMPYVVFERQESKHAINSYNCPIVSGYSDVIRSAMPTSVPVDSPVINFGERRLACRQVVAYLESLGVSRKVAQRAFEKAWAAQEETEERLRQRAEEILSEARRKGRQVILLAGRPYHADPLVQHRISDTIAAMGVYVVSDDIVRGRQELADGETNTVRQWAYVNRIIKAAQWVATEGRDVEFVQLTSFGCGPDAFIQDEVRSLLARYGKTYTLLKIDDISNVGSLKLRVRSLVESLCGRRGRGEKEAEAFRTTRIFRQSDEGKTILVPHISEFVTPLLPALGEVAGYRIEVLPKSDGNSAATGLRYANNEVCYPATLVVGDIVNALSSGRYDLERVAVAMSQTGGQCRATNYAGLIKRAMVDAGFGNVPLVTLGVTANEGAANEQEGFHVSWRKMGPVVLSALLYADTMAKMYYAAAAREEQPGEAACLRDEYLREGASAIVGRNVTKRLLSLVSEAAERFEAISRKEPTQRVGIVGEIFLKFNHFAHQEIPRRLMEKGVEIVPPLITPFFLQEFVNVVRNRELGLSQSSLPTMVVKLLHSLSGRVVERFNRAASAFSHFMPFEDIQVDALRAEGIVSGAAQFGEGWLLPAEIGSFVERGVLNVLSLQPFGCIANHVVARGIENALRRRYPELRLLSIDFDSGVSEVNIANRLLLFLNQAEG